MPYVWTKFMPVMCLLLLAALIKVTLTKKLILNDFDKSATIPLRGILAVLVMIGHLDTSTNNQFLPLRFFHWATPAVGVFFFMSGYGYEKSFILKGNIYIHGLLPRVLKKLLIPFFLSAFVWFIVCIITGNTSNFHSIPEKIMKGDVNWILPHCWYVFALLISTVAYSFLYNKKGCLWIYSLFYYIVMRWILRFEFNWWWNILAFSIGVYFARYEKTIKTIIYEFPCISYICLLIVFTIASYIAFFIVPHYTPVLSELPVLLLGPCVIFLLYLWRVPIFGCLGIISYEIYLSHGIFRFSLLNIGLSPLVYVILVVCSTLILSYLIHWANGCLNKRVLARYN